MCIHIARISKSCIIHLRVTVAWCISLLNNIIWVYRTVYQWTAVFWAQHIYIYIYTSRNIYMRNNLLFMYTIKCYICIQRYVQLTVHDLLHSIIDTLINISTCMQYISIYCIGREEFTTSWWVSQSGTIVRLYAPSLCVDRLWITRWELLPFKGVRHFCDGNINS